MPDRLLTDEEEQAIGYIYKTTNCSAREIAKSYGLNPSTVAYLLRKRIGIDLSKSRRISLYSLNSGAFDSLDEESSYWLGFLYADGCVSSGGSLVVNLGAQDRSHLYLLRSFLKANHPIYEFPDKGTSGAVQLNIRDHHLANRLSEIGIVPSRTSLSKMTESLPKNMRNHFVRGEFDGDGHRRKSGRTGILFSGRLDLLEWIRDTMAMEIGTNPKLLILQNAVSPIAYQLEYGSRHDCQSIDRWMYYKATVCLERKRYPKP